MLEYKGYYILGNTPEEFFAKLSRNKFTQLIPSNSNFFIFHYNDSTLRLDFSRKSPDNLYICAGNSKKVRSTVSKLEKSFRVKLKSTIKLI